MLKPCIFCGENKWLWPFDLPWLAYSFWPLTMHLMRLTLRFSCASWWRCCLAWRIEEKKDMKLQQNSPMFFKKVWLALCVGSKDGILFRDHCMYKVALHFTDALLVPHRKLHLRSRFDLWTEWFCLHNRFTENLKVRGEELTHRMIMNPIVCSLFSQGTKTGPFYTASWDRTDETQNHSFLGTRPQ